MSTYNIAAMKETALALATDAPGLRWWYGSECMLNVSAGQAFDPTGSAEGRR